MSLADIEHNLTRTAIVLVRPQIPANIGAAARVVRNMGLGRLIVVRPKRWNLDKMCSLAVRTGREIILEEMGLVTTLAEAVADCELVISTTARTGKLRKPSGSPRKILSQAVEVLPENRIALVFGPEDKGLTNDELAMCDRQVFIPVNDAASSINLAQAVMILAYELRLAAMEAGLNPAPGPKLATSAEVQGMYDHLQQTLSGLDSVEHHNLTVWMEAFRRIYGRARLQPHEVRLIRGFCRKVAWAVDQGRDPEKDKG